MKKAVLLFLSSILIAISYFNIWLMQSGSALLLFLIFKDYCIPILHLFITSYFITKSKGDNKQKAQLMITSITGLVIAFIVNSLFSLHKELVIFNAVWILLCSLLICVHALCYRYITNRSLFRLSGVLGSLLALSVNATLTHILSPLFSIDGIELLILASSAIFLSLHSCLLGSTMSHQHIMPKMISWLVGIAGSNFVALWLLGVPHTPPTNNASTTVLWLALCVFIFAWCVVGFAVKKHVRHK